MVKATKVEALEELPGHYIRRLQQIAVGIFLDETAAESITPVQFAVLFATSREPGLDQRTLAGKVGFDTSTLGAVVDRLEGRGLIQRSVSPNDKRVRLLSLMPEGHALLERVMPSMLKAQERMLEPLPEAERSKFMSMVKRIVDANSAWSRAARAAE
jgi:DNA-binding MarR family transcriptional regulator